ncbi:MAG TPA: hypothetical protein VHA33_12210 [Candidatus Angelobacter sp.]|nr:hypothetical protein [Candidatus Angelobacter sp.]
MERSCHRCGASFEEHTPICPSCGAAQVRVTVEPPSSAPVQRKSLLPAVLPLAFPVGLVCVAGPPLGWLALVGVVIWAVFRHQRLLGEVSAGIGARLGALMGFLSFAVYLLVRGLASALSLLPFLGNGGREALLKQIQEMIARAPDPKTQDLLRWFASSQGMTFLLSAGMFFLFIIFLVSATVTGAVTGAMADKKPQQ